MKKSRLQNPHVRKICRPRLFCPNAVCTNSGGFKELLRARSGDCYTFECATCNACLSVCPSCSALIQIKSASLEICQCHSCGFLSPREPQLCVFLGLSPLRPLERKRKRRSQRAISEERVINLSFRKSQCDRNENNSPGNRSTARLRKKTEFSIGTNASLQKRKQLLWFEKCVDPLIRQMDINHFKKSPCIVFSSEMVELLRCGKQLGYGEAENGLKGDVENLSKRFFEDLPNMLKLRETILKEPLCNHVGNTLAIHNHSTGRWKHLVGLLGEQNRNFEHKIQEWQSLKNVYLLPKKYLKS